METVSISAKFKIVIPRGIRKALNLKPGQRLQAIRFGDRVELIPLMSIDEARGFLPGIETDIPRDDDRL